MQEHTFQDAGSQRKDAGQHLTHKTQAKIKTTMTYPSRCRISTNPNHEHPSRSRLKEINSPHILRNRLQWLCFGATIAITHHHHTNEKEKAEKLEIYSVALRFQTTDGCSSSFAKDIEVKLLSNQKTI